MHAKKKTNPLLLVVVLLLIVVIILLLVMLLKKPSVNAETSVTATGAETAQTTNGTAQRIGYAENVTVASDPTSLQAAVDAMYAQSQEAIGLEYKNDAYSDNGTDFTCYIANSAANRYDMYIDIYTDAEYTDEIYLSQLLRPGTAFDHLTTNRALEPGNHQVYVAFTQIEEIDGVQGIHGQTVITMNFHVSK
jgi:uncharacterized protein YxeA